MEFLERLKRELTNPLINKEETIKEIDKQAETELLKNIKFQLKSPVFLREWCINEIEKEINKNK